MSAHTKVVRIYSEAVELNSTVAYPEGGGQEADWGTIEFPIGAVRFIWVKKLYGTPIRVDGFKGGKVGGVILHVIHPDDVYLLDQVIEGMNARVTIDVFRRQRLTLFYTASHFLYAAANGLREELKQWTLGCHIKEGSSRFDFLVEDSFSSDEIAEIERRANALIACNEVIKHTAVQEVVDARMWTYQGINIPCGGTHLDNPLVIGHLKVRRKRLGKGKERLMCEFPNAEIDVSRYHECELR